jgi:hypothetical protein
MGLPRTEPYIWTTWLTKLLVGEESCEWGAWFKAHHQNYEKVPDTFDRTKWQIGHTALLRDIREKLESESYAVFLERQNNFRLRSIHSGIVLGGQPDLIAIKGNSGLICDAKTGQPRASDHVQVMIYMWAIPLAFHQYRAVTFDGKVMYQDQQIPIPSNAINESFTSNLTKLIQRVGRSNPLQKVPSAMECGFCQIASTECVERVCGQGEERARDSIIDF